MNRPNIVAKLIQSDDPQKHTLAVNDEYAASAWGTIHSVTYEINVSFGSLPFLRSLDQFNVCIDHEGQVAMTHFWCDEVRYYPVGTNIVDTMAHIDHPVQPLSVLKRPVAV